MAKLLITAICFILLVVTNAQKPVRISSPDGLLQFSFQLTNDVPSYSVTYKKKLVIKNSKLKLSFLDDGNSTKKPRILKPVFRQAVEKYELHLGRTRHVSDRFNEVVVPLEYSTAVRRYMNLVVRAFDDGIAFRYDFPVQKNWKAYSLIDEVSTFSFTEDPKMLALFLPNFTSSHEGEYTSTRLSDVKEDTLIDIPALFELSGNIYVCVTEAALRNYAGMYLMKKNGALTSELSPLPRQEHQDFTEKVVTKLPHQTPWRVIMISDRVGSFLESNMITSLNEPSKIEDASWVKAGKTTFPWWNGSTIPDTTFAPGNNFENNKYYIDFCARNGIEYHSVVESCGHEWYTNDGDGYQPGPNADVTRPVAGLDMKQICDYAKGKGVKVRVWVHWKALYPKIDTAFAVFEKWGLSGMMVDFMDRDDQEMTNIKEEILLKAAKHKLHIQFHGVEKPTGLSRTYPNEITREGALNYEVNKWEKRITPDHDLNVVFTRMIAGPTDYHMGGFRAVPDSLFKVQYTRPLMLGTRCHMLAMYVVLESFLGMVCDYPEAYEGQEGFDFVKMVPTTWDQTKVLNAKVGEYITIARKKDEEWYVGAITNRHSRSLDISFDFLPDGEFTAELYMDAADAMFYPNRLKKEIRKVDKDSKISADLAAGGGLAIRITRRI
jgi:alpha-glucosidase